MDELERAREIATRIVNEAIIMREDGGDSYTIGVWMDREVKDSPRRLRTQIQIEIDTQLRG